ncbi:MAG: tail fiber protein [Spirochaetales bacterium]|nr:tail fiber protein [Spirochaetales bacterium]
MIYNLLNSKQNKFGKKMIVALLLLLVVGSMNIFAQSIDKPHDFKSGDIISASEMNENFDVLYAKVKELMAELEKKEQKFGYAPVGSIVAWHKDLDGTPSLPDGWMTCDGQLVSDPQSPYYDEKLPDLNGEGRFLRGSDTSGSMQEATGIRQHIHNAVALAVQNEDGTYEQSGFDTIYDTATHNLSKFLFYKVRPINMSVVWIIRVK